MAATDVLRPLFREGKWYSGEQELQAGQVSAYFTGEMEALGQQFPGSMTQGHITKAMNGINGGELTLEGALEALASRVSSPYPSPMPPEKYAAMQISEYYMETEGDLAQTVYAPAEIGIHGLVVSCPNKKVEAEAKEIVEGVLFLEDILREIYICSQVFGQAYPLEQWKDTDLVGIHLLNPTTVWTDREVAVGVNEGTKERLAGWGVDLPVEVHPEGENNERGYGKVYRVDPKKIQPYYAHKFDWEYYATPPLRPTFRTLGTRQVLDELVRATLEGFINQLWVFKLGTEKAPAPPPEINLFRSLVASALEKRTGAIIWNYGLEVEQHGPKALDQFLANEKYMELTAKIMADRGVSLRLVSGTTMQREPTDYEIDVQIMIERLKVQQGKLLRWANYLLRKISQAKGWTEQPSLRFTNSQLEDQLRIRLKVLPMYESGALSAKTALTEAGFGYDEEMANKKQEDRSLLYPPTSFVQAVVGPAGTSERTSPPGRPDGVMDSKPREVLEAAYEEDDGWGVLITAWWARLMAGEITAREFIDWMGRMMEVYGQSAYVQGYTDIGGTESINEEQLRQAIAFSKDRLGNFLADIEGKGVASQNGRAGLYNSHGRKIAYMYGVFQGMRERGAKYWRRILHPEASLSGPCLECIADARLVHSMDEPFTDHPNGVCTSQEVAFFFGEPQEMPYIFSAPVRRYRMRRPGVTTELIVEPAP